MIEVTDKSRDEFLKTQIGNTYPVLFEQGNNGVYEGSTPNYSRIKIKSDIDLCGKIFEVEICDAQNGMLIGNIVK